MSKEANKKPEGTIILPCNCKSEHQDQTCGKGRRVHNKTKYGAKCTVCGQPKEM